MLAVAVEGDDDVAVRVIEAGGERRLMTEVAAQVDGAHAWVVRRQGLQDPGRLIARAVVDVGDLEVDRQRQQRGQESRVEGGQGVLLIEHRHDHGHRRSLHGGLSRHGVTPEPGGSTSSGSSRLARRDRTEGRVHAPGQAGLNSSVGGRFVQTRQDEALDGRGAQARGGSGRTGSRRTCADRTSRRARRRASPAG